MSTKQTDGKKITDQSAHIVANAKTAAAVTPSDSTALDFNAVYVGGSGNIAIELEDTTSVVFVGVPAGTILPIQGIGVDSTSTTATSIVWLKW